MSRTENPNRARARTAVVEAMSGLGLTKTEFAREAGLDVGTVGDFLDGSRWPRLPTLAKIDAALGWAPGTTSSVASGGDVPNVGDDTDSHRMLLNVDPATYDDLDRAELAEAMATAQAVFLQKVREIRASRIREP